MAVKLWLKDTKMSEEEVKVEITQEVKDSIIKDYQTSKEFGDMMNKEKGQWGDAYKLDKLPSILDEARKTEREKVILELNPEEDPKDSAFRELQQKFEASEKKILLKEMQETLRGKAKEIGFDTDRAGRYSIYGDNAEKYMLEDHEYMTTKITSEIGKKIKGSFSTETNPESSEKDDSGYDFAAVMKESVNKIRK